MIVGCMFAGKTEELLRRVRRAVIARQKVALFSHSIDDRYTVASITSHDRRTYAAYPVTSLAEIAERIERDTDVVVIDEAQFFPEDLGVFCSALADRGLRVIAAGLDLNFRGEPFGAIPGLLAHADQVDKLSAVCVICGAAATRTQRLIDDRPASYHDPLILVGSANAYEPRCRAHHEVPDHPALAVPLPLAGQTPLGF
ncbi:MAG TPA: thymidine kinase [Chloroflexota bacterium]|nr:thymidine kinase [Chloroflexota bacterium]